MLNLIPRLYDVTEGAVEIDGVDVREIKLASLRDLDQHGAAGAAAVLGDRAGEHPATAGSDATADEVEAAAQAARADGFVQELPAKYETEVGERGVKLSVGQQQRISIARAFLKDAPILLLDEPTSALDLRTEADFLDGLGRPDGRPNGLDRRAPAVDDPERGPHILLEGRSIAEAGSHEELMELRGRYFDLFMRQFGSAGEPATAISPRPIPLSFSLP